MTTMPFRCDPARTALIVVDVQNDFCDPAGALANLGNDVGAAAEMVPRLAELITAARAVGVPVIFIQTLHDETNDSSPWLDRVGSEPGTVRAGMICRTGSWGSEFYGVRPEPTDIIVVKHRFSAFVGTSLNLVLASLGIRSLLFTGVATNVCVESSLRDGLSAEYYVSLVDDCSAAYSPAAHAAAVEGIQRDFGTIFSRGELAAAWAKAPQLTASS
ncbi:cysteine hydrolase family protein [Homoserinimonas sp. A520]